ncbi:hypothetical protein CPT_Magnus_153 [Klebsiella phage Magnus]|uniref:AP2 domain-containing protein n=1 Tax=Klebsiella phage Magnus TaxID=2589660 RepID=A0A5B9N661_9CAUD|nr:HNH endonuclease [Klebsiella phage Magnus]QEG08032.1 hypothetical protein CPT_Magnus_153 [Klebsiella phage Magnus]
MGRNTDGIVCGVGINDSQQKISDMPSGVQVYNRWRQMIYRCYDPEYLKSSPTYAGCWVCEEWLSFTNFYRWYISHYMVGYHLDKDLLIPGNRCYSPETCIFIPQWLNSFTINRSSKRGLYPVGVCKFGNRYKSYCNDPFTGKQRYIGYFSTPEDAHQAWLETKLKYSKELKSYMDAIDTRLYPNVVEIIKKMK